MFFFTIKKVYTEVGCNWIMIWKRSFQKLSASAPEYCSMRMVVTASPSGKLLAFRAPNISYSTAAVRLVKI